MPTVQVCDRPFHHIEAIVFDKDGTLAHTEPYLVQLAQKRSRLIDAQVPGVQDPLQMAFGLEGTALNPAGMMAVASRGECEVAAAGFIAETGKPWIEALTLARSAFQEADGYLAPKCAHTPLLEGVGDLVRSLAAHPIRLAILSSDTTENVEAFVRQHGLGDCIALSRGVEGLLSKPDPRLLLSVCETLRVAPSATLMVGDSEADIQMAIAAQVAGAIGVTWGWQRRMQLPSAQIEVMRPDQIQPVEP
ncbi:HAD family hydrolase [Lyngbya confervoides]|uniref:HAD family hydrolase n=1 Tax=Lyngbya confervoides BDU141951 TaxID=1574623 RepID=A0ABD4SZT4_9CYAN|nr:HAD family hydrolase [Lyngbya confervoides]MCM1981640.1 HAD family hydrolase [Lyngbya confervoides BDU141951]